LVQVLAGGVDVGVTHPRLDLDDGRLVDRDRAEGVAVAQVLVA
jgi:hypothetical protein